ncbi:protein O-mannosyl-transferase TMTC4-like [Gigantopelta aegis]|uniref:protein O-mannosyl-transferase TMTC4-like n=1 Tax=Gigantopelta aegis TaxID=1735272 RepID=UPI001B88C52F|nr:protein O-mannosyl-transferase TMTC4-like [Gigantopelta aegis]
MQDKKASGSRSVKTNGYYDDSRSSNPPSSNGHIKNHPESHDWDDCLPVPKLKFLPAAAIVFCLAVACFVNSYDGDFVFDDSEAILNNKDLLPETPVEQIFTHDFWGRKLDSKTSHKSYRPLTVLTYRWNYAWAGDLKPSCFHIVNIALHGVVSVLFLRVFSVLFAGHSTDSLSGYPSFQAPRAAFLSAVLFAVHPIHTESVAGVVGRADLLCAFTFLLSFICYVRSCLNDCGQSYRPASVSVLWMFLSVVLCVMSTFCKEQGITVIGVCSVFDIIVVCRVDLLQVLHIRRPISANQNGLCHSPGPRRPTSTNQNGHCSSPEHNQIPAGWPPWIRSLILRQIILFLTGVSLLVTRWRLMGSETPVFQIHDNPHSFVSGTLYRYDNFFEGEFVFYQHKTLPYTVHTFYRKCGAKASCNCAVAVRVDDDVVVFDKCGSVHSTADETHPMSITMYKNGDLSPGFSVYKSRGGKYTVFLPNGAELKVRVQKRGGSKQFINVWFTASSADFNQTQVKQFLLPLWVIRGINKQLHSFLHGDPCPSRRERLSHSTSHNLCVIFHAPLRRIWICSHAEQTLVQNQLTVSRKFRQYLVDDLIEVFPVTQLLFSLNQRKDEKLFRHLGANVQVSVDKNFAGVDLPNQKNISWIKRMLPVTLWMKMVKSKKPWIKQMPPVAQTLPGMKKTANVCQGANFSMFFRVLIVSMALLVVPFLPASNVFFRVGFVVAERILYLSSAGFCMLVTLGAKQLSSKPHFRQIVQTGFVFITVMFVIRSVQRSNEWRTEMSLFMAGENVCPLNAKVHYNIAKLQADNNNTDVAIDKYRLAIRLNSEYDQAMNNLANILKDQGQSAEAEELLLRAVQISPEFAAAWMNLGIVQAELKKTVSAEYSYLQALRHRRNYPDCYYNLGNLYLDLGRHGDALMAWRNSTKLKPTHVNAWTNTLILLDNLGQHDDAIRVGQEALKVMTRESQIYFNMANVFGKMERYRESEDMFLKAIQLDENNARFHLNLGVLYHRWGKLENAETVYKKALLLEPNDPSTAENLKMLYRKMGKNR